MDENLPVNKRPDYLEHLAKLKECHDYLVGQMGYRETYNKWCSYEFTTIFKKESIEIIIVYETSIPSSITLVNTELTYDESRGLTNVEYFATFNKATFEVIKERLKNKERKK
jgi:hypothetical protein